MCGINTLLAGMPAVELRQHIERMNQVLSHRGPDAQGEFVDAGIAIGHTRLSIVDVKGGVQPMHDAARRYVLSFNGEIYNYRELRKSLESAGVRFQTRSDTEVLLQLLIRDGLDALQKLTGMFAFVFYDREEQRLLAARDRLGIKPLFYFRDDRVLLLSSEMKTMFATGLVPRRFNMASLYNFFHYQFSVSPHTAFENILELPPGFAMQVQGREQPRFHRYWDLHFPEDGDYESLDGDYWLREFEQAIFQAADSHLIGEADIGAYLSGGIDSSTMAWLLSQRYKKDFKTFSIRFSSPEVDESQIYRNIAAHLNVPNHEILMDDDSHEQMLPLLAHSLYHLEQPQRVAVDIPHFLLSALVRRHDYKVVYTGDGADELFGGYDCYRQDYMRYWGNQVKNQKLRRRHYMSEYTRYFAPDYVRLLLRLHRQKAQRRVIRQFGCYPAWHDAWQVLAGFLPALIHPGEWQQQARGQTQAMADAMRPMLENRHMLNQSLYIENKTRLSGWILWKSDRLSMSHGVEARVPFMDHHLVELCARMPPGLKLNGMDEKFILKKFAQPHLPGHPQAFKKKAFYTPIKPWFFRGGEHDPVAYYLGESVKELGFFNGAEVARLYRQLQASQPRDMNGYYHEMQLEWLLTLVLSIQLMYEMFIKDQPLPALVGAGTIGAC